MGEFWVWAALSVFVHGAVAPQVGELPVLSEEVVEGAIDAESPRVETPVLRKTNSEADLRGESFAMEIAERQTVCVELRSHAFDAYLVVRDESGAVVAEADGGGAAFHARAILEDLAPGTYVVVAASLDGSPGPFTIRMVPGAPRPLSQSERIQEKVHELRETVRVRTETFGLDSAPTARAQLSLVDELGASGAFGEARELCESALAALERHLGPRHPETVRAMASLGSLLLYLAEYEAAGPVLDRALAIAEEDLGPSSDTTTALLNTRASLAFYQADFERAEVYFTRLLEIAQAEFGAESIQVTVIMSNLAFVIGQLGRYDESLGYLRRVLPIRRSLLGDDHPATGKTLNDLALGLFRLGDLEESRRLYEEALAVREGALGPDHPGVAETLDNYAELMSARGEFLAARRMLERSLDIRERAFGPDHPEVSKALNDLGLVLHGFADYETALSLFERSREITRRTFGERSMEVSRTDSNIAAVLFKLRRFTEARRLREQGVALLEELQGQDSAELAIELSNLAVLLGDMGEDAASLETSTRALRISERVLGEDHPVSLRNRQTWSQALGRCGREDEALSVLTELRERLSTVLGADHVSTARTTLALANLESRRERHAEAAALYEEASRGLEKALGLYHPDSCLVLRSLAITQLRLGRTADAWKTMRSALERGLEYRWRFLGLTGERESFEFLAGLKWSVDVSLGLAEDLGTPEALRESYQDVLAWKGQVFESLVASRAQGVEDLSTEQERVLTELRSLQRRLSGMVSGEFDGGAAEFERAMSAIEERRGVLELEWRTSIGTAGGPATIRYEDLRDDLPPGSATLDTFVWTPTRPPAMKDGSIVRAAFEDEARIAAWIVRPGRAELVRVDLGVAADIERALRAYLTEIVPSPDAPERGTRLSSVPGTQAGGASQILRELFWDPLVPHLEGVDTIFFSPDGFLGGLPIGTIRLADGTYLIERYRIVYLQDVSSVGVRLAHAASTLDRLLVVGAVDFDAGDRSELAPKEPTLLASRSARRDVGLGESMRATWSGLPGTGREAVAVLEIHEQAFGAKGSRAHLRGPEATEERLKRSLADRSVLHLATHGYFEPEGLASLWRDALGATPNAQVGAESRLASRHPGLLSGLVCAGVNARPGGDRDDGYLTAEEVGWLDLEGAELVVLSACETGLGRARSGEGMIGLRRSFQVAGARTVVSSLWSVPDAPTAELMEEFYRNLLVRGLGRVDALRAAQRELLDRNRDAGGEALPHTWGAFVLDGDWR